MIKDIDIVVAPRVAATPAELRNAVAVKAGVKASDINDFRIISRSIDARQRQVKVQLTVRIATDDDREVPKRVYPVEYKTVTTDSPQVIIVGAGPAGLFAALRALELGMKPVVIERGKDVDSRRHDLTAISRSGVVDPDSNYCFGEGGAGAYSDGKLFTRSTKRGNVGEILNLLVIHGADPEILVDAHPHIGSDRLPGVIRNIRQTIINYGGEVHFSTKASGLIIEDDEVKGIIDSGGKEYYGSVIIATGHSARDVYRFLNNQGVRLEAKGLAIGVRLEHPQRLIDQIRYHSPEGRGKYLPAAEYVMKTQADGRGVYSFCMCPGGVIVPAASAPGESVVNGMSASARSGKKANSGMVVEIRPGDFPEYEKYGELQLLELQKDLEKSFYEAAGKTLKAPAQRMTDFVNGKISKDLPTTTYVPGLISSPLHKLLPPFIADRLRKGFSDFGRKHPGFLTAEACMIGLESRTSSPVRIPRDRDTLSHTDLPGLYPAGEGAGYAGGIVSAAIDGRRAIDALASKYSKVNTSKVNTVPNAQA